MVYKLVYTSSAQRDLSNLSKKESKRILQKLSEYINHSAPLKFAKKLKGLKNTHYRYRVGSYRVIFRLDSKTRRLVLLVIIKIAHRKYVY